MNYENVDENATYRIACENVKKIVNAIKALKIKYYPNFDRISEEDKTKFDELQQQLEKISAENGLNDLKVALMEEVSSRYDQKKLSQDNGNSEITDDILKACYGATDAEVTALSGGKIKQAQRCQEILNQYIDEISSESYKELITEYRRRKFGELTRTRENKETENERWSNNLKFFYKPQDREQRKVIQGVIKKISRGEVKNRKDEKGTKELEVG